MRGGKLVYLSCFLYLPLAIEDFLVLCYIKFINYTFFLYYLLLNCYAIFVEKGNGRLDLPEMRLVILFFALLDDVVLLVFLGDVQT